MGTFSQWFSNKSGSSSGKDVDFEGLLAECEAEAERTSNAFQGTPLNRAGDLCLKAGDRLRALGYYGRAIDKLLEDGQPEAARGVAKKIIRIHPEAVRTLCTLTWLDIAAHHMGMALIHLGEYTEAVKRAMREELARAQILSMASALSDREFLQAASASMERLGFEDEALQIRGWVLLDGSPDAIRDPAELADFCLQSAVGSNAKKKSEGALA